tara:strand:- start:1132 stop:1899 length:768 start_codon:yes stop_codon:yes gene_type:complete
MKKIVGIPARLGSSRFPGKPMCKILDYTMIEHCYIRSKLSKDIDDVFVAICDDQLKRFCIEKNIKYIMTDPNIQRPSLRVSAACETLDLNDEDIVVVVQGDEPLVTPDMISLSLKPLINNKHIHVSNLCYEISEKEMRDPNEIKVVMDNESNALYMSRSPIPSVEHEEIRQKWFKQVCIMPFKWKFLYDFNTNLSKTSLELQESIEMLRAIQHGYKVRMVISQKKTKSVDCEQDRLDVENLMKDDNFYKLYKKNE